MAKKVKSHLSYCAGKEWDGDGTKGTSPCPFNHSRAIDVNRYVCCHCSMGRLPKNVYAPADYTKLREAEAAAKQRVKTG